MNNEDQKLQESAAALIKDKEVYRKLADEYTDPDQPYLPKVAWHKDIVKPLTSNNVEGNLTVGSTFQPGAPWQLYENPYTKSQAYTCNFGGIYTADPVKAKDGTLTWQNMQVIKDPATSMDTIISNIRNNTSLIDNNARHLVPGCGSDDLSSAVHQMILAVRYGSVCRGPDAVIATGDLKPLVAVSKKGAIDIYNGRYCIHKLDLAPYGMNTVADMFFLSAERFFAVCEKSEGGYAPNFVKTTTERRLLNYDLTTKVGGERAEISVHKRPYYHCDPMTIRTVKGTQYMSLVTYNDPAKNIEKRRLYEYVSNGVNDEDPQKLEFTVPIQISNLPDIISLRELRYFPEVYLKALELHDRKNPIDISTVIDRLYHTDAEINLNDESHDPSCAQLQISNFPSAAIASLIRSILYATGDVSAFIFDHNLRRWFLKEDLPSFCAITNLLRYYQPDIKQPILQENWKDLRKGLIQTLDRGYAVGLLHNNKQLLHKGKEIKFTPMGSLVKICPDTSDFEVITEPHYNLYEEQFNRMIDDKDTPLSKKASRLTEDLKTALKVNIEEGQVFFDHNVLALTHQKRAGPKILNVVQLDQGKQSVTVDVEGNVTDFAADANCRVALVCKKTTPDVANKTTSLINQTIAYVYFYPNEPTVMSHTQAPDEGKAAIPKDQWATRIFKILPRGTQHYVRPVGLLGALRYILNPKVQAFHNDLNVDDHRNNPNQLFRAEAQNVWSLSPRAIWGRCTDLWNICRGRL
jgi:hypothetical protein